QCGFSRAPRAYRVPVPNHDEEDAIFRVCLRSRTQSAGTLWISYLSDSLDDEAASIAKLVRKLTQAYSLSTDPQAIELHKPGIVQLDRDACPESVEVIRFTVGSHV